MKVTINFKLIFVLAAFLGIIIAPIALLAQKNANKEFSFIFMSDIHIMDNPEILKSYRKAIAKANSLSPDFVLTGGDNVFDVMRGNASMADSLFTLLKEENKAFKAPIYTTLGNHDLFGIYKESNSDSTHVYYKYALYEKHLGKTYHSFDHKGWHFVILNDLDVKNQQYFGSFDYAQLEWLKNDLAKIDKKTPVVIVMHIPLVSVQFQVQQRREGAVPEQDVVNKYKLFEILEPYNFKIALQGHLHFFEDIYVNQKTHFITGGAVAGRPSWRGTVNGPRGFVNFKVKGDQFNYDFVEYEK